MLPRHAEACQWALSSARVLSGILLIALGTAAPVEGPVAVLPFKNLNADLTLDWLKLGMAETLIADLRRSGKMPVVERAQIDKALTEMALQGMHETEESTASHAGKLVGARTVVLGSFQRAGQALRINARFVSVETGVIIDAAKATGTVAGVFALQDQVVDKLIGRPAAERPTRKTDKKTVRAYELYARSLAVASDAERVGYLKSSLEADPGFVYARDELTALESRMRGYSSTATARTSEEEAAVWPRIEDAHSAADARLKEASALVDGMIAARRFNTLADSAVRLASVQGVDLRELAAYARFDGEMGRHRYDAALGAGERYLKDFPTGPHYREVEKRMGDVVAARKKRESRAQEYATDIAGLRQRYGEGKGLAPEQQRAWDYAPCIASRWNSLVGEVMLRSCSDFLSLHARDTGDDGREKAAAARFFVILGLSETGELARAQTLADELQRDTHAWDDEIHTLRNEWPTDMP
jgi:TolB-like protein